MFHWLQDFGMLPHNDRKECTDPDRNARRDCSRRSDMASAGTDKAGVQSEQLCRIVHGAVAVAVVAYCAVELMVAQNPVECLHASSMGSGSRRADLHTFLDHRCAGTSESTVDLDDARVAGLDRPQLRVIADLQ
jgi:hypothetical protein